MRLCKFIFTAFLAICTNKAGIAEQNTLTYEPQQYVYDVIRVNEPIQVDSKWDKQQWMSVKDIEISNFILDKPMFFPAVKVKMAYDDENIYVIFRVQDRYVRSITTEINGPVWKDSAVEFFFSPDTSLPSNYFNLEINCAGTPLLGYNSTPRIRPDIKDIGKIEIGHSLSGVIDPEIREDVLWTIECRIPLVMLEKYSNITRPRKGVTWRGNFYKIAKINSNPHDLSWTTIDHPNPTFHLPQFFGRLRFQ